MAQTHTQRRSKASELLLHSRLLRSLSIRSPSSLYDTENPYWTPSLKLGYPAKKDPSSDRLERAERRASKTVEREVEASSSHESPKETEEILGVEIQTDITARGMEEIFEEISALRAYEDSSKKEIQVLKDEVARLTARLSEEILEIEGFKGDDQKILFYTGLNNWSTFSILLDYLQPHLMQRAALSPFQQVLMTLMRLRGLSGQDLAY